MLGFGPVEHEKTAVRQGCRTAVKKGVRSQLLEPTRVPGYRTPRTGRCALPELALRASFAFARC